MCILKLSKVLIYGFHYDYIKNKYGNNLWLLFTDNDSLMYENKTKDIYQDFSIFSSNKEMLDFNNYSAISKYYDDSRVEFVGLKSNTYSFLIDENTKHKKANGVNKNVVPAISHNE